MISSTLAFPNFEFPCRVVIVAPSPPSSWNTLSIFAIEFPHIPLSSTMESFPNECFPIRNGLRPRNGKQSQFASILEKVSDEDPIINIARLPSQGAKARVDLLLEEFRCNIRSQNHGVVKSSETYILCILAPIPTSNRPIPSLAVSSV